MWDWDPKTDKNIQNAVREYLHEHNLKLEGDAEYVPGIDYVSIEICGIPVLEVNLPPVSNYSIGETEHTRKYLRKKELIAV